MTSLVDNQVILAELGFGQYGLYRVFPTRVRATDRDKLLDHVFSLEDGLNIVQAMNKAVTIYSKPVVLSYSSLAKFRGNNRV